MPSMANAELRGQIDGAIGSGEWQQAARGLRTLWESDAGAPVAGFVVSRFEKLRGHLELTPHRCAILRSFTVEPMVPLLRAAAFVSGIDLTIHLGDFNT